MPSNVILIENTKLFFVVVGCVYIYNLSNKKVCVYNKKSMYICVCMCVCVWGAGGCLDKYINIATPPPPKTKIFGSTPSSN